MSTEHFTQLTELWNTYGNAELLRALCEINRVKESAMADEKLKRECCDSAAFLRTIAHAFSLPCPIRHTDPFKQTYGSHNA